MSSSSSLQPPTYIADVTQDPEYEPTKVFLKQLTEVSKTLTTAITRSMTALETFVQSLEAVQRGFDQFLGIGMQTSSTEVLVHLNAKFGSVAKTLRQSEVPKTAQFVQHECVETLQTLVDDQVKVEQLRKDRKKLGEMLEAAKKEVDDKELEYSKKNRPLTESKLYGGLKAKYGETERQFIGCMNVFRRESKKIFDRKNVVAAHGFSSYLEHVSNVTSLLSQSCYGLFELTARNTHPELFHVMGSGSFAAIAPSVRKGGGGGGGAPTATTTAVHHHHHLL